MEFLKIFKDPKAFLIGDSAFHNSSYLLLNNVVSSLLGFFFWLIAARLYSADEVGLAVILITTSGLISTIARFGIDMSIVKYYSDSVDKRNVLNTFLTTIVISTVLVSIVVILYLEVFSNTLDAYRDSLLFILLFVIISVLFNVNTVLSSVFISARKTIYFFIINTISSSFKIFLSVMLTGLLSTGIFLSWGLSYFLGYILSIFGLRKIIPGYSLRPTIDIPFVKRTANFSFANFLVNIIGNLPPYILPLIIARYFSSAEVAYYYVSFSIVSFLYAIPATTSLSLFAEISHEKNNISKKYFSELKRTAIIAIPIMVILVLFGNDILTIYGQNYSTAGSTLLSIFAIATVFIAINNFYTTHLRVEGRLVELILVTIIPSLGILTISFALMALTNIGISGIGLSFLISHALVSAYIIINIFFKKTIMR